MADREVLKGETDCERCGALEELDKNYYSYDAVSGSLLKGRTDPKACQTLGLIALPLLKENSLIGRTVQRLAPF